MATRRGFLGGASALGAASLLGAPTVASAAATDAAPGPVAVDPQGQARDAVLAVNSGMRANYAALKADLVKQLSPVVVVQNDAKGGKFTLVWNGTQESVNPVSETFELAKSISHVPLGIFSVLAAYLSPTVPNVSNAARIDPHDLRMVAYKSTDTTGWIAPLQAFGATLATARQSLAKANLPQELTTSCGALLDAAGAFITATVQAKRFDMKSFEDFTAGVYGYIRTNMKHAAAAQIAGVRAIMQQWRGKIGEAQWQDLYTVVLSQWTTYELNQNSIIIRPCMNPVKVDTHLIDLATVEPPSDPVFVALDNLARIVQDNVAAELVFVADTKVADALKGRQDLLSDEILGQIGGTSPAPAAAATAAAFSAATACPFGHKASNSASPAQI
ncbi:hypothetical protein [Kitasatospora viridis]|uniref:Secreted protein n=1 Tax=Kitasatospora viridis TaxID=281105 RepID=A0A561SG55_9ACTN|nr:hypothetical protein [Kitasatospora viridis]TWF73852.1 hypothetical protein FHX73_15479 [Kitasatospora viridis]